VVDVAKTLAAYTKDNPLLVLRGGILAKAAFGAADVETLAKLPARPVMLGRVVGTIAAPMMQLVGVFHQKACSLLYVLKAIEQKKGGSQQAA